jgi:hypothetical protein
LQETDFHQIIRAPILSSRPDFIDAVRRLFSTAQRRGLTVLYSVVVLAIRESNSKGTGI